MDEFQQTIFNNLYKKYIDRLSYEPDVHIVREEHLDNIIISKFNNHIKDNALKFALANDIEETEPYIKAYNKFYKNIKSFQAKSNDYEFLHNLHSLSSFIGTGYIQDKNRIQRMCYTKGKPLENSNRKFILSLDKINKKQQIQLQQYSSQKYSQKLNAHTNYLTNYFNERSDSQTVSEFELLHNRQKEIHKTIKELYLDLNPEYFDKTEEQDKLSRYLFTKLTAHLAEYLTIEKIKPKKQYTLIESKEEIIIQDLISDFHKVLDTANTTLDKTMQVLTLKLYISQFQNGN